MGPAGSGPRPVRQQGLRGTPRVEAPLAIWDGFGPALNATVAHAQADGWNLTDQPGPGHWPLKAYCRNYCQLTFRRGREEAIVALRSGSHPEATVHLRW